MRTFAWNCEGAGRAPTVRAIRELIHESNSEVVFLSETKSKTPRIGKISSNLKFVDFHCVEPSGRSGGLALFWRLGVDLEVVCSDINPIAAFIYSDPPNTPWERLDQCLCNQEWQLLFPKAGVKHLCNSNSDHNPILLDTYFQSETLNRPFKFEAMWTKEESSKAVVDNAWQFEVEGSHGFHLANKLERTKKDLKKWNREVFGIVRERIKSLQANIAEIQLKPPTKENLELEAALSLELEDWLLRDELRLKQKSRELWLTEGD
nr:hypothetical protein CFP56_49397 [Quercus suber]